MWTRTLSVVGLVVAAANAQQSTAFTDPITGITFQAYQSPSYGYSFGLAIPTTPTNQFIGQLIAPIADWAGVSLGGPMIDSLLIPAWSYNGEAIYSLRMTDDYVQPVQYTEADSSLTPMPTMTPLACGTYANDTHWSLTFTCTDCNTWTTTYDEASGFALNGTFTVMGWALGTDTPTDPSDPNSDFLEHTGFGEYGMILALAGSADYDTWVTSCGGGSSKPTVPTTSSSSTAAAPSTSSSSTSIVTPSTSSTVTSSTVQSTTSASSTVSTTTARSTSSTASTTSSSTIASTARTTSTSSISSTKSTTSTAASAPTTGAGAAQYAQCGGAGWTGPTTCISPFTCTKLNDYYYQCL